MGKRLIEKTSLQRLLLVSMLCLCCSLVATACAPLGNNAAKPIASKPVTEPLITWPAFDGGGTRDGVNPAEQMITPANVGQLKRLWQQTLVDVVDSSPVVLPRVHTANGIRNLLFVTTKSGSLLAIDADADTMVWRQTTKGPKITNSSPAIDPSGKFVYSYGVDGKVHKYMVDSGQEITDGIWPATITLMPDDEKGSSALNIGDGYLYATTSGYIGDGGHYEGHVVAIQLATGKTTVFNVLCANIKKLLDNVAGDPNYCPYIQAGVWARAGAVVDPVTGNVFIATGNGPFDAQTGGHDYGDSVIELSPDLTRLIDTYTPDNYQHLQDADADLGSAAPALLPKQNNSQTPYLAVQAGKDNKLRLLDRQNLSGQHGPNNVGGELQTVDLPNACDVPTHPLAWNDPAGVTWLFVANGCGFSAFKVITNASGQTRLQFAYKKDNGGSSPFMANDILFIQSSGEVCAMNPRTGDVMWSSSQPSAGGSIGALHWQSPIVVNGRIYVPDDDGQLSAYGLV